MTTSSSNRGVTGRLVGVAEIAEIIGHTRQRARTISKEAGFPAPLDVLGSGPVWWRADVETYLAQRPADRRRRDVRIAEGRSVAS